MGRDKGEGGREGGRGEVARGGGGRERKVNTYSGSCVTRLRFVWILLNFVPSDYVSPTS